MLEDQLTFPHCSCKHCRNGHSHKSCRILWQIMCGEYNSFLLWAKIYFGWRHNSKLQLNNILIILDSRQIVRNSWGNMSSNVKIIFVMGTLHEDSLLKEVCDGFLVKHCIESTDCRRECENQRYSHGRFHTLSSKQFLEKYIWYDLGNQTVQSCALYRYLYYMSLC